MSHSKITAILFFTCYSFISIIAQSLWSDPATWGGVKPVAGDNVVITSSMHVILDEDTPDLGGLTIDGILEFDHQDLSLTADWIMVMGEFWIGTQASPYAHQAIITLNADDPTENQMGMGTRGLMVMGGLLELHGIPPTVPWTKINVHATVGTTSLTLMESVNWNNTDQIAIAPTDFYEAGGGVSITETVGLTSVNGDQLTLASSLNAFHWGLLQYANNTGMSLTNTDPVTPPASSGFTPTILDQRAPVGNLTRNIVIQAPDDILWNNNGFGCHIMVMRMGMTQGVAHIDGVEIRRGGQAGMLGRYPFHWHMLSYEGATTLADATGQFFRNSVVHQSAHRGIVIHGTNGVEVSDNVVYDVRGHGVFLEDASERRNLIDGNLVMHIRNPAIPLKQHETGNRGSSGFWISNPDNTITNNTAADCGTNGFWLAFPIHPWGLSIDVPINPSRILFGVFDNNTAHSNRLEGIMLDNVEVDSDGNTFPHQYLSTTDGQDPSWPFTTLRRFALERYNTWKNGAMGIWDRGAWADNYEIVSADNCGRFFAGSGADGVIERALVVGTSLNHLMNGTDRPNFTGEVDPAGFATYHSAFDIKDNIIIHFDEISNTMSGAFATQDYYIRPVDKGQVRNENNLMIDCHPGVKLMASFDYFALAGALWDPHDNWGGDPTEDNYFVYDTPFFTNGQTPTTVPPGAASGGVLVEGPFYGFNDFVVNEANIEWEDYMEIHVERLDDNLITVGSWTVTEADPSWALAHMRHFAAHPDDYYTLVFPNIATVSDIGMAVENMLTSDDTLVLGIEYSGDYAIDQVYISSWWNYMDPTHANWPTSYEYKHVYTAVGSRQEVIDSPGGQTYWHDTANDMVWIKIQGGIEQPWDPNDFSPTDDELLYREFHLRVYGSLALPVELTDFSARLNEFNEVELNWETASETGNEYFMVERSHDGKSWQILKQINGKGNSTERNLYKSIDTKPLIGYSYYRLKQVDFDGRISYSKIVSIYFSRENDITVFPNPTHDIININLNTVPINVEFIVQDGYGKIVLHKKYNDIQFADLDVSNLEAGIYFLKIKNENGDDHFKIVKQ